MCGAKKENSAMTDYVIQRPAEILLVEDNPGDARLAIEALKEAQVRNNLHIVPDGVEAMAFLHSEGRYAEAVRPDVILLDLNLPKKDGRAVLAEVKANPHLKCIPVIILSSSQAEEDIIGTYNLHANCYINKPLNLDKFIAVMRSIETFWLTTVTLPPTGL
jgi:two-component system, chemotaxis family, response regulator Rcp1